MQSSCRACFLTLLSTFLLTDAVTPQAHPMTLPLNPASQESAEVAAAGRTVSAAVDAAGQVTNADHGKASTTSADTLRSAAAPEPMAEAVQVEMRVTRPHKELADFFEPAAASVTENADDMPVRIAAVDPSSREVSEVIDSGHSPLMSLKFWVLGSFVVTIVATLMCYKMDMISKASEGITGVMAAGDGKDGMPSQHESERSDALISEPMSPMSAVSTQCQKSMNLVRVVGALVLSQAIVGGWPVMVRTELHERPGIFILYRMVGASIILLALMAITERQIPVPDISKQNLLIMGFFTVTNCYTYLRSIQFLGTFIPTVGETFIPVVVVAVCIGLGMEQIYHLKIMGISCAVFGSLFLLYYSTYHDPAFFGHSGRVEWGIFFFVGDIVTSSAYYVFQKKVLNASDVKPIVLVAYSHFAACLFAVPLCLMWHPFTLGAWALNEGTAMALIYSIVGESVIVFTLLAWANQNHSASLVAASTTLQPVFAALIQYGVLGKLLDLHDVAGSALVILGLTLCIWDKLAQLDFGSKIDSKVPQ